MVTESLMQGNRIKKFMVTESPMLNNGIKKELKALYEACNFSLHAGIFSLCALLAFTRVGPITVQHIHLNTCPGLHNS